MVDRMVSTLQNFCSSGSGFIVSSLEHLDFSINLFKPIRGSSYLATPMLFKNNNFLLNIKNKNQLCFIYAILAAVNPEIVNNQQEAYSYKGKIGQLVIDDFDFPIAIRDVTRFEKINKLSINIFDLETNQIFPLYLSKNCFKTINLLLFFLMV